VMGLSWPLYPHRKSPVLIEEEARWAPEPT